MDEGYKIKIQKIVRTAARAPESDPPAPVPEGDAHNVPGAQYAESPQWRKIGKTSLLILLFLTPLFFLPGTPAPLETSKTVLALFLLTVSGICFFAMTTLRRTIAYPRSAIAASILLLLAVVLVSALFSKSWGMSFYGNLAKPDSLLSFLIYALTFFFSFAFFDEEDTPTIALLFSGSVLAGSVLAILGFFGIHLFPWDMTRQSGFTTVGSLSNWGMLAGALAVAVAAAPFHGFSRRTKILLAAAGIVAFLDLVMLKSQLLWGILSFLMIVIAAARFVRRERFGVPLTSAVVSLFFTLVNQHIPPLISLPGELTMDFTSTFRVAWGVAKSWRVFLGFGPATFGYAYSLFRPIETNLAPFWGIRFEEGHDLLTGMFVATGIAGIVALGVFIAAFLRHLIRELDKEYVFIIGSTVLFLLIGSFFYSPFFSGLLYVFFGLGLMASLSRARHEAPFPIFSKPRLFGVFIATAAMIAISLAFLYVVSQKYAAAAYYEKGLTAVSAGNVPQAIQNFRNAIGLDPSRDEYWRATSQALLIQAGNFLGQSKGSPGNANIQAQALSTASAAITAAREAARINPADALNWDNAGNVYENLIPIASGADAAAIENYREALARDPKNAQEFVNIARTSLTAGDKLRSQGAGQKDWMVKLEDARPNLESAIQLKPDYALAYFLLAQLYIREGNVARAIQNTEQIKAQNPFDTGVGFQLGLLYYQNGAFDQARSEFERTVALDPNYSNARYFLGLIYDRGGLAQNAREQFQKIADLNPDNAEVKQILANLNAGRSALQNVSPPAKAPEKRAEVPVPEKGKR